MAELKDTKAQLKSARSFLTKSLSGKFGGGMAWNAKLGEPKIHLDTGNYALNACMTGDLFKGVPDSYTVGFVGESGSGKSYVMLNITKNAVDAGVWVVYIDTEGALTESKMRRFGIDVDSGLVDLVRTVSTFEDLNAFLLSIIEMKKENPELKVCVILDSYAHLTSSKEIENAGGNEGKQIMGGNSRAGNLMFRTTTLQMSNLNIPFLYTNHVKASLDPYKEDFAPGGSGQTFAATFIVQFNKSRFDAEKLDKLKIHLEEGGSTGIMTNVKLRKNRDSVPFSFEMLILHNTIFPRYVGMNRFFLKSGASNNILKEFIDNSWELFGLCSGKVYSEQEFKEEFGKKEPMNSKGELLPVHPFEKDGKKYFAVENPNVKGFTIAVKDTAKTEEWKDRLTPKVLTQKTLEMMNENVVKRRLEFKNATREELEELRNVVDSASALISEVED